MERKRLESGFTIMEVLMAGTIFVVASAGVVALSVTMDRHDQVMHELELAEETARRVVEDIQYRARDSFPQLCLLYDDDPTNDPDGTGTAPGNTFGNLAIPELATASDSPTGQLVEILLWTDENDPAAPASFGFPRDLNADGDTLDDDVTGSFRILPITVRIHWSNQGGSTLTEMETVVTRQ